MKPFIAQLILGAALVAPASLFAQAYSEGIITMPGAVLPPSAYGIDDNDQVVGVFEDGSSGESVGNLRVSALGLSEEAVELAAGGVEGALLVFPSVVDQRPAVLIDHVVNKLFRGALSQPRLFVHIADDLSAEKPHIVDVVLDGPFR